MNPTRLLTLTATITHLSMPPDPETDEYGNPQPAETTITADCELQQTRRAEDTVDADRQVDERTLFLSPMGLDEDDEPVEVPTSGYDSVDVAGDTFQLIGPPWRARNPRTGEVSHIEALVRQVT